MYTKYSPHDILSYLLSSLWLQLWLQFLVCSTVQCWAQPYFLIDFETEFSSCVIMRLKYWNHQGTTRLNGHWVWSMRVLIQLNSSTSAMEKCHLRHKLVSQIKKRVGRFSWSLSKSALFFFYGARQPGQLQDTGTESSSTILISLSDASHFYWINFYITLNSEFNFC